MKTNPTEQDIHLKIRQLLPWYATSSLPAEEVKQVQTHLSECAECREELADCQVLAAHPPTETEVWSPSPAHFADIMSRIDALEGVAEVKQKQHGRPTGFLRRLIDSFGAMPRPYRWAFALETAACFGLMLALVGPYVKTLGESGAYQTLSSGEAALTANGALVRVLFADDLTTGELAQLLKLCQCQVRQGPSAVGSFVLEVPTGQDDNALAMLRANPKVRLAQPIDNRPAE